MNKYIFLGDNKIAGPVEMDVTYWKDDEGDIVKIKPDPYKIASMYYGKNHDKERDEYFTKLANSSPYPNDIASLPKIEVVKEPTHSWGINQIIELDVDFEFKERWFIKDEKDRLTNGTNIYTAKQFAVPISKNETMSLHPEDKNTYQTQTGALISAHDYQFLSDSQKQQCKIYNPISNPNTDVKQNTQYSEQNYSKGEKDLVSSVQNSEGSTVSTRPSSSSNSIEHRCNLSDSELLQKVYDLVGNLCTKGDRVWRMTVPVDFNGDSDMILIELCKRYSELLNNEPNLERSIATGDAILMNDDNKKINPVKEGEMLYSKEDIIGFADWIVENRYTNTVDYQKKWFQWGDWEEIIHTTEQLFNLYLSSPEFKNNQK